MMKHEFEAIAGYEVSFEDYNNIIEPMYMSTNLDKYEFVKCIDKKRFALASKQQLINKIKKLAKITFEKCGHVGTIEEENEAQKIMNELTKRFGGHWRISRGYEFPETSRGCTYMDVLVHYSDDYRSFEEYELIK